MNKCALVLGAVAIATLAGCKDPDYKHEGEQSAQNQVKPVTPTPPPAPAQQPISIEPVSVAKCTCLPGTKHKSPCMCGASDCRCIVVPQKVAVADVKPAPVAAASTTYIVQRGDSLSKISKKFNIRVDAIRKANPKIKNDTIRIGQKLTLPGKVDVGPQTVPAGSFAKPVKATKKPYAPYAGATKEYVVKNGDMLGSIAYANGISIRQLKELNGLSSNALRIGQKLKIPASGKAAKAAAKPTGEAKGAAVKAPDAPKAPAEGNPPPQPAESGAAEAAAATTDAEKTPAVGVPPAPEAPAEKAPQAQKQPETPTTTYVVQEGDDMTGISIRWAVSAARIRELNNLSDDAQLLPGQILKIPVENQQ